MAEQIRAFLPPSIGRGIEGDGFSPCVVASPRRFAATPFVAEGGEAGCRTEDVAKEVMA